MSKPSEAKESIETRLNRLGRHHEDQCGFVNPPIYHGSTVIFKTFDQLESNERRFMYGTFGNPTVASLQEAWCDITGAAGTVVLSSGLAAVTTAVLTVVKAGDTVFFSDSVYLPTRQFCDEFLRDAMNINVVYYDPLITAEGLRALHQAHPRATLLFLESPGSQTFEIQDVPALTAVARELGLASIIDNTWATPVFFDALGHGCDMSVEAGTKYLGGHSDILLGLIAVNEAWWPKVKRMHTLFSHIPGNEDCFLALRGLRTMHLRLKEAESRALDMARWLQRQPQVLQVLHPALEGSPGHEIWKRDFTGSSGLFAVILQPRYSTAAVRKLVENSKYFSIGFSWGGFESLAMIYDCSTYRTATSFTPGGVLLRLQIGLENLEELRQDLAGGLANLDK